MQNNYDIVVIGGGSAGLASAIKASKYGLKVAIIERDNKLGGILNQCIHNGFGLSYFKQELTGPEYANKFIQMLDGTNIDVYLNTTVLEIKKHFEILTISPKGLEKIVCKGIVLATGCRERPSGAINLCGSRPAGIISAGSAQKIVNLQGKMIGKDIVIVGSGDIGLIMARRLRFEGANVIGVYEIMPYPSGLKRNIVQCLDDYNIPLHLSKTVVEVVGKDRVKGVFVAPVKNDFSFDLDKREFIKCDTIVLSIGLTPSNELANQLGLKQNPLTNGCVVDEYLQTSTSGIFSCGNGLHVHDIVDNVTRESERAGENCAKYVLGQLNTTTPHSVYFGDGLRYVNPSVFYEGDEILTINFRSSKIYKNADIIVKSKDKEIRKINKKIILPAEMESVIISKKDIVGDLIVTIKEHKDE